LLRFTDASLISFSIIILNRIYHIIGFKVLDIITIKNIHQFMLITRFVAG